MRHGASFFAHVKFIVSVKTKMLKIIPIFFFEEILYFRKQYEEITLTRSQVSWIFCACARCWRRWSAKNNPPLSASHTSEKMHYYINGKNNHERYLMDYKGIEILTMLCEERFLMSTIVRMTNVWIETKRSRKRRDGHANESSIIQITKLCYK